MASVAQRPFRTLWTLITGLSLLFLLVGPTSAYAATLSCAQVDGDSIFGYDGSNYVFIGAIANDMTADSIANEFGAGNDFNSTSIMDTYGPYGGEFSDTSAFNDFASSPPVIVDDNYQFVGYLTTGDLSPNINTYAAIGCAKDSFASPNTSMEDAVLPSIPGLGYSSGYTGGSASAYQSAPVVQCPAFSQPNNSGGCTCDTGYEVNSSGSACIPIPPPATPNCPMNAHAVSGVCTCDAGFVSRNGNCISNTADCQLSFGNNVVGVPGSNGHSSCSCVTGYEWNTAKTACQVIPRPVVASPQPIVAKSGSSTSGDLSGSLWQTSLKEAKLAKAAPKQIEKAATPASKVSSEKVATSSTATTSVSEHKSFLASLFSFLDPLNWF